MRTQPAAVVVVEVPPERRDDARFVAKLTRDVAALSPAGIAFVEPLTSDPEAYRFESSTVVPIILGQPIASDPFTPHLKRLKPLPATLVGAPHMQFGATGVPSTSGGVVREQHRKISTNEEVHLTLEAVIAAAEGIVSPVGEPSFLVSFRGSGGSLPTLQAGQLENLASSIIEGRWVLIGIADDPYTPRLTVPTSSSMSRLEYYGHSANTLLTNSEIVLLPNIARVAVLILLALVVSSCVRRFEIRISSWIAIGTVGSILLAGFSLFVLFGIWSPVLEVATCAGVLYVSGLRQRAADATRATKDLIADASSHLQERYWASSLYSTKSTWTLIAHLINQTLDVNRVIFLEANTDTHRLTEIVALNSSLGDIVEARRDYRRSPYVDAIDNKGPIKVKSYLAAKDEEEIQFLCPLMFSGRLLGFWALGIDGERLSSDANFYSILRDYTLRISELLYHYQSISKSVEISREEFAFGAVFESLRSTLDLLQYRLETVEVSFNKISSGILVFDVFGRLLQSNRQMDEILNKEGINDTDFTALDVLIALSDLDIARCRDILRRVIVDNSPTTLPVRLRSASTSRFIVHLKPLSEEKSAEGAFIGRVGAKSILFELVDTTAASKIGEMKSRLTDKLGVQIREELASIEMAASLLERGSRAQDVRDNLHSTIRTRVGRAISTVTECRQFLNINRDLGDLQRFPVDLRPSIREATELVSRLAQERGLRLEVTQPNFVSFVLASSSALTKVIASILRLLCQDATDHSVVSIRLEEGEFDLQLSLENVGFGIPDEIMQEYVHGSEQGSSSEMEEIQSATRRIESWGGTLEATSGVGIGMRFSLRLAKFL